MFRGSGVLPDRMLPVIERAALARLPPTCAEAGPRNGSPLRGLIFFKPAEPRFVRRSSRPRGAAPAFEMGGKHPVPEVGDNAVITGSYVVMMRHVANARGIKQASRFRRHMMGSVMHEHVEHIADQRAAAEAARDDEAEHEKGREEQREKHDDGEEGRSADEPVRIGVMGVVKFLEERHAVVEPAMHRIFDEGPGTKAGEKGEKPG